MILHGCGSSDDKGNDDEAQSSKKRAPPPPPPPRPAPVPPPPPPPAPAPVPAPEKKCPVVDKELLLCIGDDRTCAEVKENCYRVRTGNEGFAWCQVDKEKLTYKWDCSGPKDENECENCDQDKESKEPVSCKCSCKPRIESCRRVMQNAEKELDEKHRNPTWGASLAEVRDAGSDDTSKFECNVSAMLNTTHARKNLRHGAHGRSGDPTDLRVA
eukprot:TRINITY_DN12912_c2_g1_i1.p1 TRINITY_DN12912_c2_g1~~TRINITY_DN12912_c2_g1_i1.p1  ORF type:complete len:249 (+),score=38.23 TRINITY_DN12912_c2_g1_i1:107-748(+)